jgi:arsenical pump membrane protein
VPEGLALALSLAGLAATLAAAVARPRWLPEAAVAVVAAAGLVAVGAVTVSRAGQAVGHLAPTIGFLAGSLFGASPVWIAAAGAAAITVPALVSRTATAGDLLRAIQPSFLLFVLGLGVIVAAASDNGLAAAVRVVLPGGISLPALLGIAAISALLANLVNNLPAILIIAPVALASGPAGLLAALVGVNVGPNLTHAGSLATLLWRRLLRAQDTDVNLGQFLRLGAATVPAALAASTLMLWSGVKVGL